jgi:hypothetical protein
MRFSNCGGVYILTVPEDEDVMRRDLLGKQQRCHPYNADNEAV